MTNFRFPTFTRSLMGLTVALTAGSAQSQMLDDFTDNPGDSWSYVSDRVMGGVSNGYAELLDDELGPYARLVGEVSTDNNGGFIQIRRWLDGKALKEAKAVKLSVRGTGDDYYVFLRTNKARRSWHSYRATFTTSENWSEQVIPFSAFERSNWSLPQSFKASDLVSIGIVAYGKDFEADLSIQSIEFLERF